MHKVLEEEKLLFEKKLDAECFRRVHRSAIVNLKRVEKITPVSHSDAVIKLHDGDEIKMSRTYKNDVISAFKSL